MIAVERELEKRLKQLRVHIDAPDGDTVFLRNVPASDRFFNKPRTNLLIKRPQEGLPYLICVDEDLEYIGKDSAVARAFIAGHKQQGWRVLSIGHGSRSDIHAVIEQALTAIGFDGGDPELKLAVPAIEAAGPGRLLASFATEISTETNHVSTHEPTIGREERIEEVVASLLQWQVRLPLIVGESGVGKTNLTRAVARKLKTLGRDFKVLSIELGALMAGTLFDSERESLLIALLKEVVAQCQIVLVIEHLEMALIGVPRGCLILTEALDRGLKLIGTTLPAFTARFEVAPLSRRVQMIDLTEMSLNETDDVLRALRDRIGAHHKITIDESLLNTVLETAVPLTGHFPAKAISLLDAAAARAVLGGETELSTFDIYSAVASFRDTPA